MTDAGYTATEALAALAIIGLAVAGLASGMQVISRGQSSTTAALADDVALRSIGDGLDQLLARQGPFRSDRDGLQGDSRGFSFACGALRCGAEATGDAMIFHREDGSSQAIALPQKVRPAFRYGASDATDEVWPPASQPGLAPRSQILRMIALTDATGGGPLGAPHTVWVQQAADCQYDSTIRDCRGVAP
jgi:hypothetical protein